MISPFADECKNKRIAQARILSQNGNDGLSLHHAAPLQPDQNTRMNALSR
jgi:hypothetical protein